MKEIRTVDITRYITPLREGGSLPAIVEADDGFLYVLKFRGAGQGIKALIAELIGGEVARALGFRVPEIVLATVDPAFGRTEPDEEIQDLLKFSEGLNLALHYLSGAITFDPAVTKIDALTASKIVWLDALLMNVDRTVRNTNMLMWQKELWLIDHGASLYFHHADTPWQKASENPFVQIKDHVLLSKATELDKADEEFKELITISTLESIVSIIPDEWLVKENESSVEENRIAYTNFLIKRMAHSKTFIQQAQHAQQAII
ncbi:MAG: aminotransferase class I and II [Flavisolibacter sp.]|nr:aminotransferase class I and II [Flavisolibacter sp.]